MPSMRVRPTEHCIPDPDPPPTATFMITFTWKLVDSGAVCVLKTTN